MAEAHQADAVLLVLHLLHEVLGRDALRLDLPEHVQHGLVGATVQRAVEGVDAGGHRGEQVGLGGADQAHRGGGGVLLVVGVQHEQQVEGLDHVRVDVVFLGRHAEAQAEEVLHVVQRVVRVHERLAQRLLERVGGQHRQLAQQTHGGDVDLLRIVRVQGVRVERGQPGHGGGQHRHGVRVPREAVEEQLEVLVHHVVAQDVGLPGLQGLLGLGQLAVDQQVGHLHEGGVLGEVLDGVAAVAQDALVAVDERDGRLGVRRVHEARVVGDVAGLLQERGDVDAVVALCGVLDAQVQALLADGQPDGLVMGHGCAPSSSLLDGPGSRAGVGAPTRGRLCSKLSRTGPGRAVASPDDGPRPRLSRSAARGR